MVPLIDSIRSYTSNYFSNKTANVPPVTQCSNGEGIDLVEQMKEAGVTGIQEQFPDGGTTDATMCYESGVCTNPDDAGNPIGQYPTNDAGAIKLPDDVSQPVKDPNGNDVQRFTEAYPRIVIRTGNLSGSGLQNLSIIKTVFGTDSTLIRPTPENPNIPKMPGDPANPDLGSFPGEIYITPAQTIGGDTQACSEAGYEGFAVCPSWSETRLPLLVDLYRYVCYDKFDQDGNPVGSPLFDSGDVTVDPPAPLGTMPWGIPGPDAYEVVHPHACYHADSGRAGNLAAVITLKPLVDVQQANGSSVYQTWFWARTFAQQ